MWDLPGPGLEPVSPALAGRFLTTAPPGKSLLFKKKKKKIIIYQEKGALKLYVCAVYYKFHVSCNNSKSVTYFLLLTITAQNPSLGPHIAQFPVVSFYAISIQLSQFLPNQDVFSAFTGG